VVEVARLAPDAPDAAWADVALGQAAVRVTPLHLSRFLQAVGADGREHPPTVETARAAHAAAAPGRRVMRPATAARLQGALRAAVDRGTAAGVRPLLAGSRWRLGGKTGTAGDGAGGPSDGWFVGLVFDDRGAARYTVVVYVRGGGAGGGVPARLAASLTRFLAGDGGGPALAAVR
jgi:cell division protein FtsI/penicillin-binding protein 2